MSLIQIYRSRKYFQRLLLYIALMTAVFLLVPSLLLYYQAEQTNLDMQNEANEKVLAQIDYNISSMNEIIQTLAVSIYVDNDIKALLTSRSRNDAMEIVRGTNKVNAYVDSNTFLNSIVAYNGVSDQFFVAGDVRAQMQETHIRQKIEHAMSQSDLLAMRLVPMSLYDEKGAIDIFSVFMFQSLDGYRQGESALVLNIKSEWLFNNLKVINQGEGRHGAVYILNGEGDFISDGKDKDTLSQALKAEIHKRLQAQGSDSGFFVLDTFGGKQIVDYTKTAIKDWNVVSIQPYDEVMGRIDRMRTNSLWLVGTVLLLSLLTSFLISFRLYRPIEKLTSQIRTYTPQWGESTVADSDELSFVSQSYNKAIEKIRSINLEKAASQVVLKTYALRRLVADSSVFSKREWNDTIARHALNLNEGPYLIALLKIDQLNKYEASVPAPERKLHAFAIPNIAQELLAGEGPGEVFEMKQGQFAVLVETGGSDAQEAVSRLQAQIKSLQDVILKFYHVSLSAAIGNPVEDYTELSKAFNAVRQLSSYKIIFGYRSIIMPEMVPDRDVSDDFSIPVDAEKKFIEALKLKDSEQVKEQLARVMNSIRHFDADHIIYALQHFVMVIKTAVKEINANRVHPVVVDLSNLNYDLLDKETLEEMHQLLLDACMEIGDKMRQTEADGTALLAETIKEIVARNYADMNLSLPSIADTLKMSTTYLGRIFRNHEMLSLSEYINEVRLNEALKLLEETEISVNEVMERAGFSNQSHFFKLFKKKFSTTPKEYRTKKSMSRTLNRTE